ncbi:TIGR03545 family protein [Pseudidiomarina indica]|uniref:TIGR03545 family protein n=1 Tax=Pseudidiomarina indica TaxID=1159017 RepID=A0A1G6CU47_9GAMM|nr:TIGR03545 family protein [Pseudidiomarina indica]SDB36457.1 TIGR03545 family protein [Pseudidiomarina indica]
MSKTNISPVERRSTIRWSGLGVFLIICGLLFAFSWLLLDSILKWTIERSVGAMNGAEVNVSQVDHRWSPLGIEVRGIQVTDPAQPDYNRLVIDQLKGSVNVEQLLLGRLHIEDMVATGIRVHQPRAKTGEVYQTTEESGDLKQWALDSLADLNMALPDVDEIVARIELQTPAAIERAKATVAEQREVLAQIKQDLPSAELLKSYEEELKKLTETDIKTPQQLQQLQDQFNALKEQFEADRERLKSIKERASQAVATLKEDFEAVQQAPSQDIERAQQLLQFNSEGFTEITAVLFGDQMRQWSQYILLAYDTLAPMLARSADESLVEPQRGEGVWFEFSQADEPPSFLVKKAVTEFVWGETRVDANWTNITHQHQQLGQPTTFQVRSDQSPLWQLLNLNGELALTDSGVDAKQQWQVKGVSLEEVGLSDSSEFTASIVQALVDSEGAVSLRDSMFDGGATVKFAEMAVAAQADNRWAEVVASALRQLQRLDINANIAGALTSPEFSFASDLDRQLGAALKDAALDASKGELAALQTKLQAESGGFLGENQELLEGLMELLGDAEQQDNKLEEMMKAKFERQLEDKLKDRLKGVFGR